MNILIGNSDCIFVFDSANIDGCMIQYNRGKGSFGYAVAVQRNIAIACDITFLVGRHIIIDIYAGMGHIALDEISLAVDDGKYFLPTKCTLAVFTVDMFGLGLHCDLLAVHALDRSGAVAVVGCGGMGSLGFGSDLLAVHSLDCSGTVAVVFTGGVGILDRHGDLTANGTVFCGGAVAVIVGNVVKRRVGIAVYCAAAAAGDCIDGSAAEQGQVSSPMIWPKAAPSR